MADDAVSGSPATAVEPSPAAADAGLNPQQAAAVTHGDGPLLIVAGAGTGKTTVVTRRVHWLITSGRAKPDGVLALTFTDKAAGEMAERLDRLLPYGTVDLWVMTFHAFCQRLLTAHGLEIGLADASRLLDATQQWLRVRRHFERFALDHYRPLGNPTKFIHALLRHFSRAKDEAISPEEYLAFAKGLQLNTDGERYLSQVLSDDERAALTAKELRQVAKQELAKVLEVAEAYHTYHRLLAEEGVLDFGDLITQALRLLRERPKVLARYRAQFSHLLVDEFQDTNWAQYELVKLLAEPKKNITVVGDDDQCLPAGTLIKIPGGSKPIESVAVGDHVIAAVGRGYVAAQPVTRVFRRTKLARLVTFTTARGLRVTVTDNHKMFCLVPAVDDRRYHYVYLMERRGLGWRIGVTNDLSSRLRLERSADRILGVRTCTTDAEARYYETFYSLTYGIPTVCFAPREGVAIQGDWLPRLYRELDVEAGVRRLADDCNLDLRSHHASLGAVKRGGKLRVKISLEMCHRRYSSKHARRGVLQAPWVAHGVQLETSDPEVLRRLRRAGFTLTRGKRNGYRLRMVSQNLTSLGQVIEELERVTGGMVEVSGKLGRTFRRSRKSLVMPAKNVLVGQYLPIVTARGVIYDRVVSKRLAESRTTTVYDLEVAGAHNFVANGIVVHNSIYKFRGASVANILQFKHDYPGARQVLLTTNYRSRQNILDLAYGFIQRNNPERLEVSLGAGASKRLVASRAGTAPVEHLAAATAADEVRLVVEKINELKAADGSATWSDFAILVRANDHAEAFTYGLDAAGIPYYFVASRGLYRKAVVLDVVAFLKLLDDYREGPAMYRYLSWPVWSLAPRTLADLTYAAKRRAQSLYHVLQLAAAQAEGTGEDRERLQRALKLLDTHAAMARQRTVREVALSALEQSGTLAWLGARGDLASQQAVSYLNQFFTIMADFEATAEDRSVRAFLEYLRLQQEAGESGPLQFDPDQGPEAVRVMTVHAAKGLEFRYVFVVNLVDRRFPTAERADPIPLPEGLIREPALPHGDVHLQEERRLFYVACTRAKDGLWFSSAASYGGTRARKPSQFLLDLGIARPPAAAAPTGRVVLPEPGERFAIAGGSREHYRMPPRLSFSQLRSYDLCPWQYRFKYLLQIPVRGKGTLSFGNSIHLALQRFFALVMQRQAAKQGGLFDGLDGSAGAVAGRKTLGELATAEELLKLYEEAWVDEWYDSPQDREEHRRRGRDSLAAYYERLRGTRVRPKHLEVGLQLKLPDEEQGRTYAISCKIDRVDQNDDGSYSIVDYKTGTAKEALSSDDKQQLLIYQLAARSAFDANVRDLTFEYLEAGTRQTFLGSERDLSELQRKILASIREIERGDFVATPGPVCKFCDYREICEFRQF